MIRLLVVVALLAVTACATDSGAASDIDRVGCDPSPVDHDAGNLPVIRAGDDIEGRLFYYDESYDDVDVAVMPPHGRAGSGRSTKILWRAEPGGGSLIVRGVNLTGEGAFEQSFPEATSPQGDYPSIIELPGDGCWELEVADTRSEVTFTTDAQ